MYYWIDVKQSKSWAYHILRTYILYYTSIKTVLNALKTFWILKSLHEIDSQNTFANECTCLYHWYKLSTTDGSMYLTIKHKVTYRPFQSMKSESLRCYDALTTSEISEKNSR